MEKSFYSMDDKILGTIYILFYVLNHIFFTIAISYL